MKRWLKRWFLPSGERAYRIRGGALRGMCFFLDLQRDTQVWRGIYERSLQQWLVENVREDAICMDVGAAEGWATLLMAKLARRGEVFAFEPSERGSWIIKNMNLNKSNALAKVTISQCFVSDRSETSKDGSVFVSLDDFALKKKLDRIDIVKIDVDGPENEVLDGARHVLSSMRPAICVEAHSRELLNEVLEQLQKLNYQVRIVDPPPHEYRPLEYNPMVFGTPLCQ